MGGVCLGEEVAMRELTILITILQTWYSIVDQF